MLRTHAGRYGLMALVISLIFIGLQITLELLELHLPITWPAVANTFDANEISTIAMALIFTGLAWWAGRQRDRIATQRRYVEALNRVTLNLLHAGDLDRALNEIMPPLTRALDGEDGVLFVIASDHLIVRASTPNTLQLERDTMHDLLTQHVPAVFDERVLTFHLADFRPLTDAMLRDGCRQVFAVILPDDSERRAGWLVVATKQAVALTPEQEDFLQSAAGQIAVLLSRTRQVVELRRRARDLEAIAQVNRSLLAGMELDELLEIVVSATYIRFGLPLVSVLWVDEEAGELYVRAVAGPLASNSPRGSRQKIAEGNAGIVYRAGKPYLAQDGQQDLTPGPSAGATIQSSFLVPMKVGQRVVGIMVFDGLGRAAFSAEDVTALTTLTDLVTIATGSAHLVAEAQRERRRVSAILRSTVDVILLVDAQGLVQLMNPAAERLLSQVADEAVGRPIEQVLTQRSLLNVYRHAVTSSGLDAVQAAEATLDNGATYLITITLVRDEDHTFLGRVVALKDITPLKQLDRYKSQMLQMASHDLRTPLGVATGYVELLEGDLQPLTPIRRRLLQGLEGSLERMENLITELLDVERVESGIDVAHMPLDVRQLVGTVVQELQDVADRQQQTLKLDEPPQIPTILGDPVRLKQAFSNLVDNALKYTPEGGQVWVRLKHNDNEVVFEVQDTGYGIPLAAQAKLFQRFYRAKVPGTETTPGTGLGLSLVKAVVEQHGGRVAVESVEKQGSTFRVWLPAAMSDGQ